MPTETLLTPYLSDILPQLKPYFSPQNWEILARSCEQEIKKFTNPNTRNFLAAFEKLPELNTTHIEFNDTITIGRTTEITTEQKIGLTHALEGLIPWRKGPFNLFGVDIDTEWQSQQKWNRIAPHLPPLENKTLLDIGSNSGYYMFRMAKFNPKLVLGVDPSQLFFFQFLALQRYANQANLAMLPTKSENLSGLKSGFDGLFSMGILYHQRHPIAHLKSLAELLKPKGWAVVETLIMPESGPWAFCPHPTYAKMPNVHFIPTRDLTQQWLSQAGFKTVKHLWTTPTTTQEQGATAWTRGFVSLEDFIHPTLPNHTIEGYPGPLRAAFLAEKS